MTGPDSPLTQRQLLGLELTAAGHIQRLIARYLCTSESSFCREQTRLRLLIGAVNAPHSVALGYELGLLRVGEKLWTPPGLTLADQPEAP